jgi:hypothetical protein
MQFTDQGPKRHTASDLPANSWKKSKTDNIINLSNARLCSLLGSPETISYGLNISNNPLTNLEGCPKIIPGNFHCVGTPINSLVGGPITVKGYYDIDGSYNLISLVGSPRTVGGYFACQSSMITNLDGLPISIGGGLLLSGCEQLTTLRGINKLEEIAGGIHISNCPIESHILGVFFINRCQYLTTRNMGRLHDATTIVNNHIRKGRSGLFPCTQELIEAGLAEFAQI